MEILMTPPEFVSQRPCPVHQIDLPSPELPEEDEDDDWSMLDAALLPPRLQEFARVIGLDATMRLVERYGGRRIYVPATPRPGHPLAELIGHERFVLLCEEFSADGHGLRFELPKADRVLNALRNARIRADYGTRKSLRKLALEHGLTERHIARIVADAALSDREEPARFSASSSSAPSAPAPLRAR